MVAARSFLFYLLRVTEMAACAAGPGTGQERAVPPGAGARVRGPTSAALFGESYKTIEYILREVLNLAILAKRLEK